jgi:hypothetical protein
MDHRGTLRGHGPKGLGPRETTLEAAIDAALAGEGPVAPPRGFTAGVMARVSVMPQDPAPTAERPAAWRPRLSYLDLALPVCVALLAFVLVTLAAWLNAADPTLLPRTVATTNAAWEVLLPGVPAPGLLAWTLGALAAGLAVMGIFTVLERPRATAAHR